EGDRGAPLFDRAGMSLVRRAEDVERGRGRNRLPEGEARDVAVPADVHVHFDAAPRPPHGGELAGTQTNPRAQRQTFVTVVSNAGDSRLRSTTWRRQVGHHITSGRSV